MLVILVIFGNDAEQDFDRPLVVMHCRFVGIARIKG